MLTKETFALIVFFLFTLIVTLKVGPQYVANNFYLSNAKRAYIGLIITIVTCILNCLILLHLVGKI